MRPSVHEEEVIRLLIKSEMEVKQLFNFCIRIYCTSAYSISCKFSLLQFTQYSICTINGVQRIREDLLGLKHY